MNKKTLALTLGGAIATVLTASPLVNAQENPFGMQKISGAQVLAKADTKMPEGACSGKKMKEGKCGEGKCGAKKGKMTGKMKEGSCSGAAKMKEAGCSGAVPAEKMKEGGCSGAMPAEKMKEGGCSGAIPAEKMKEGGCSGKM